MNRILDPDKIELKTREDFESSPYHLDTIILNPGTDKETKVLLVGAMFKTLPSESRVLLLRSNSISGIPKSHVGYKLKGKNTTISIYSNGDWDDLVFNRHNGQFNLYYKFGGVKNYGRSYVSASIPGDIVTVAAPSVLMHKTEYDIHIFYNKAKLKTEYKEGRLAMGNVINHLFSSHDFRLYYSRRHNVPTFSYSPDNIETIVNTLYA